jgi:hypothetical protein
VREQHCLRQTKVLTFVLLAHENRNLTKTEMMMMENEDLERIHTLETAQATQTATVAGMQTAQAVAHSGTWAVMGAGGVSLVVGIFLGMAIAKH